MIPGHYQNTLQTGILFHCKPFNYVWIVLAALKASPSLWFSCCMPALMSLQQSIFQGGPNVPRAASGAVTTTGQVCQPTGSSLGNGAVVQRHRQSYRDTNDTSGLEHAPQTRLRLIVPPWHCDVFKGLLFLGSVQKP